MGCELGSFVSGHDLVVDSSVLHTEPTYSATGKVFPDRLKNCVSCWWDQGTSLLYQRVARSTQRRGYWFEKWKEAKQDNVLPPRLNFTTKISHRRTWNTRKSTNQQIILRPKAVRSPEAPYCCSTTL